MDSASAGTIPAFASVVPKVTLLFRFLSLTSDIPLSIIPPSARSAEVSNNSKIRTPSRIPANKCFFDFQMIQQMSYIVNNQLIG